MWREPQGGMVRGLPISLRQVGLVTQAGCSVGLRASDVSQLAGLAHSCHLFADETLVDTPDLFNDFKVAESQSRPSYSPSPLHREGFYELRFDCGRRTGHTEAPRSEQCDRIAPSRNG